MLTITGEIPRVEIPSVERFVADFLLPQRPAVLTGVLADWPALAKWNSDHLKRTVGAKRLRVESIAGVRRPVVGLGAELAVARACASRALRAALVRARALVRVAGASSSSTRGSSGSSATARSRSKRRRMSSSKTKPRSTVS